MHFAYIHVYLLVIMIVVPTVKMHFDVWTGVFLEEEEEMDVELSEAEQLQLRLDQLLAAILNKSSSRGKH